MKISIVIPSCDRQGLLIERIPYVVKSAPQNAEIIIVNDGKEFDNITIQFLDRYKIRFVKTAGYTGAGSARNLGVKETSGDWIFFLDDDDIVHQEYWRSVESLIKNKNYDNRLYGFSATRPYKTIKNSGFQDPIDFQGSFEMLNEDNLKSKLFGTGCGFWISRILYTDVGGISEDLVTNEDTDLCIKLHTIGGKCYKNKQVGVYTHSGEYCDGSRNSVTKSTSAAVRYNNFIQIINNNSESIRKNLITYKWITKRLIKYAARSGNFQGLKFLIMETTLPIHIKVTYSIIFYTLFIYERIFINDKN